jgi:hypothetical protein
MTDGTATVALHPEHLSNLQQSGLSDLTIREMGAYSLSPTDQVDFSAPSARRR